MYENPLERINFIREWLLIGGNFWVSSSGQCLLCLLVPHLVQTHLGLCMLHRPSQFTCVGPAVFRTSSLSLLHFLWLTFFLLLLPHGSLSVSNECSKASYSLHNGWPQFLSLFPSAVGKNIMMTVEQEFIDEYRRILLEVI